MELAKPVIVKLDEEMIMAVVPASREVDLSILKGLTGANVVALARESEFPGRFPECDTGAMPPFGNLYQMPVFLDETLTEHEQIAFNAGTHVITASPDMPVLEAIACSKRGADPAQMRDLEEAIDRVRLMQEEC